MAESGLHIVGFALLIEADGGKRIVYSDEIDKATLNINMLMGHGDNSYSLTISGGRVTVGSNTEPLDKLMEKLKKGE